MSIFVNLSVWFFNRKSSIFFDIFSFLLLFYEKSYVIFVVDVLRCPAIADNVQRLGTGGASTAVRTGDKLLNLH